MRKSMLIVGVFASLLFALAGCGLFGSDDGGRVIIRLTDNPADADSIIVSIVSCELIDTGSGERETVVLDSAAQNINLLNYQDGLTVLIADVEVGMSEFDQFRLQIGDAPTIWFGEDEHPIHVASGSSSGIKFFLDEPVPMNGGTFDVTLDFDAQASVVALGPPEAPTGYVLTPVIKPVMATMNGAELSVSDGVVEQEGP